MTPEPAAIARSRSVGVDLGSRRIGIAVSDGTGTLAFPWGVIERTGDPGVDRRRLAAVVAEADAGTVVVGLPLSLDGRRGDAARAAEDEASLLAAEIGDAAAVVTFDERLTTVSAQAALAAGGTRGRKARQRVDGAAATVLLQAWLDAR